MRFSATLALLGASLASYSYASPVEMCPMFRVECVGDQVQCGRCSNYCCEPGTTTPSPIGGTGPIIRDPIQPLITRDAELAEKRSAWLKSREALTTSGGFPCPRIETDIMPICEEATEQLCGECHTTCCPKQFDGMNPGPVITPEMGGK